MKTIKCIVYKEGKHYVFQCLNVEVSSFENSIEDATENLKEALNLYFEDIPARKNYLEIKESLMGELTINF